MTHIYVTTDTFEAEWLTEPGEERTPIHEYQDLDNPDRTLVERLGFSPMSIVTFKEGTPQNAIEGAYDRMAKAGLFVALEQDGEVKKYEPANMLERNAVLTYALTIPPRIRQPGQEMSRFMEPGHYLLLYSNAPSGKVHDWDNIIQGYIDSHHSLREY